MSTQTGAVHSIQSLGTLDGPGVRFVVFLQGCPLSCGCCHNPDTQPLDGGTPYTAKEIVEKAKRYTEYFGDKGGITLSGGEPLLQAPFAGEVFSLCHEAGIHTCLDTSGCLMNDDIKKLLYVTDRVLLDIKYTNEDMYQIHVGCSLQAPLLFLKQLEELSIPTTLRQVIIPTLNDNKENISILQEFAQSHRCVDSVELLPFRKLCQTKYDAMHLPFPFAHLPEPDANTMKVLSDLIHK
ncbi:MAG: pyruvate formate lyase-activating protein [Ruminococcaceae bacterium]|nr:pyruvate formate lyase-activating protein [Oscillospiraceae bacterium]